MDTSSAEDLRHCAPQPEDAAFLAALDQSPLPMWLSDADYEGSYFNRAWLAFRGRDLSQEIGGGWLRGIHPEDLDGLGDYADALSEGRAFQVEYRLLRHDGAWRWMLDSGAPRFDPEGRLTGFIGSCVDITARREAEAALAESEARLRSVTENLPGYIFRRVVHPDGRSEYPLFRGAPDAFVPPESPDALIHPEDRPAMAARYAEAAASMERLDCEARFRRPDGPDRWIRSVARPHPRADGALVWDGVMLDITAQRDREAARERAAMMLGMSLEIAAIGTWEFDPETGLVTASARTQEMFGLPAASAPRPVETYLGQVHADDRAALRDLLGGCPEGGEASRTYRLSPGGGALRWVSTRGRMVRLADGSRRLIGAITDITEAKRIEAEREAALAHRQTLLAELNHRMKNNLHLILSMLRLEAGRDPGPKAFAAAIERIEAVSALHAQLDFDEGPGRVDFGAYLRDLAAKLRRSVLEGTGIALDCDAAAVELDLDRAVPLGIVVNELVTNAIKYAFPQGGGRIALRLSRTADGGVLVVVEDDGRGPERSAVSTAGSGLGTRLVAGLCAQISARIDSRSLPGMRHEIHLPLPA
ncbi:PAS domain-containing protein [Limimaricola hongkongensis]|uniref:histidine kinase n=1 Tax=Limimaricola hongkongensis DSM 17492 TaxID=1122180 RepID=A0A017HDA1_9RHOB|nr:PAS domain-containing protein [Limimaricola hongkongensis]EYD72351.1 hypothetical protein Lokhon_01146 [Limimaricola hongkongensis DSM 17492]